MEPVRPDKPTPSASPQSGRNSSQPRKYSFARISLENLKKNTTPQLTDEMIKKFRNANPRYIHKYLNHIPFGILLGYYNKEDNVRFKELQKSGILIEIADKIREFLVAYSKMENLSVEIHPEVFLALLEHDFLKEISRIVRPKNNLPDDFYTALLEVLDAELKKPSPNLKRIKDQLGNLSALIPKHLLATITNPHLRRLLQEGAIENPIIYSLEELGLNWTTLIDASYDTIKQWAISGLLFKLNPFYLYQINIAHLARLEQESKIADNQLMLASLRLIHFRNGQFTDPSL